ncbi:hypothetical protein [Microvirga sp. 2TAF3]|uniref:hypothetical protein n=1 Tax=Microvirga sp. 2TAF3 TaxID=3233014 RepID=UPI003F9DF20B
MIGLYADGLRVLEQSGPGRLARQSSWIYPFADVMHVLGAAFVVGAIAVFDCALVFRRFEDAAHRT